MREAAWMAGAAIGSWLAVSVAGGDRVNPESFFGMLGPLVAVCASWVTVKRTHQRAPERVMAVMTIWFALKFVYFGAYVVLVVWLLSLRTGPFIVAFVSYFIALYAMQAMFLRRLSTTK